MKKGRAHKPTGWPIESKVENILHENTCKPHEPRARSNSMIRRSTRSTTKGAEQPRNSSSAELKDGVSSEMTLYPAMVPVVRLRAGCKGVKVQQRTGAVYKPQIKGTSAGMNIQLNSLLILENEKEINESLLVTAAASLSWGTRWPSFIFTHEDLWLSVSALSLQVWFIYWWSCFQN